MATANFNAATGITGITAESNNMKEDTDGGPLTIVCNFNTAEVYDTAGVCVAIITEGSSATNARQNPDIYIIN